MKTILVKTVHMATDQAMGATKGREKRWGMGKRIVKMDGKGEKIGY